MAFLRAATDNPFGAYPHDMVLRVTAYNKDASAARIYPGDFVILEADGNVAPASTVSASIIGVAAEGSAASTADTEVLVYDHPEQLFVCQDDSDTSYVDQAAIGLNYDTVLGTGDTTRDRSTTELDTSSGTTATAQLRLVGLHPIEGGTFATTAGQPRKVVVLINEHLYRLTTGV